MTHPYTNYENTEIWKRVEQIISDLVENQDIKETTNREHIVGFICKNLIEMKGLK